MFTQSDYGRQRPADTLSPRPFRRGADDGPRRLGDDFRARLPHDTWDVAAIPAGVRLELVSRASAVVVDLETSGRHPLAAPTMPDAISVWRGEEFTGAVHVPVTGGETRVTLEPDGAVYTLYLPEALLARPVRLAPVDGQIDPAPLLPRWLAYGDSITQGWSATDPGRAYPALAGRRHGLDTWNLGFAGAARGEIAAAGHLAATEADVISLAFGTNNWSAIPTGAAHLAGILQDFVAVIRSGHPATPIVVVSPIVRPDAEHQRNVAGATLADLRQAIDDTTRQLASCDPALSLVPGQELVTAEQLADGIHPGDEGHRAMADAVGTAVAEALAARPAAPTTEEVPA